MKSGVNIEYSASKAVACTEHILRTALVLGIDNTDIFYHNQLDSHSVDDVRFQGNGDKVTASKIGDSTLDLIFGCVQKYISSSPELSIADLDKMDVFEHDAIRVGNCFFGIYHEKSLSNFNQRKRETRKNSSTLERFDS